jgi:hypothetical protein
MEKKSKVLAIFLVILAIILLVYSFVYFKPGLSEDRTIITDEDIVVSLKCTIDEECVLVDREDTLLLKGIPKCCPPCGEVLIDYSLGNYIAINKESIPEADNRECLDGACPACVTSPTQYGAENDRYKSRCVESRCTKVRE